MEQFIFEYYYNKYEMPCIYMNSFIFAVGGFASAYYWSSTEYNNNNAWKQNFDNGNQNNNNKNNTNRVRAVRDFKQAIFSENLSASAKALIVFSFLKNIKLYKLICATFIIRHTTTQN